MDLANPYGWLLPWPQSASAPPGTLKRISGARVILVDGTLLICADKACKHLYFFGEDADEAACTAAFRALVRGRREVRVETINGEPARVFPRPIVLRDAGFTADHRGLIATPR